MSDEERERGREVLRKLTEHLPRRKMTDRERAIFDEHKRYVASGGRMLTNEEWEARRRSTHPTPQDSTNQESASSRGEKT